MNVPEPTVRRSIEDAIERLMALLDFIDGDPDLEDGGDTEPNGDEGDFPLHFPGGQGA